MTESLAPPREAPPAPAGFGVRQWARWFWRQLTSMRVALLLLFGLALASIPGSLFPQRGTDPARVATYLAENPTTGPWLDRLSMFDVYASPWFAAVYLLLFVSLAGCIVPRTLEYARSLRRPPPAPPSRLARMQGFFEVEVEGPTAADELSRGESWLRKGRWRVRTGEGWVAAEKGYLREAGNLLFHVSLLVLLASVAVGSMLGWRGSVVVVEGSGFANTLTQYDSFTSGRMVDRSSLAPFSLRLVDFEAEFERGGTQNGAPREYRAEVLYRSAPDEPERSATISVNDPLEVAGSKVFLTGHGYAPQLVVRDSAGRVVYDDAVVFLPRDRNLTSTGVLKVPDSQPQLGFQGIFLPTAAVDPELGPVSTFPIAEDPAVFLSAWQGDLGLDSGMPQSVFRLDTSAMTQIGLESLRPGQTWTLPDGSGSVEFTGVTEFANFSVAHDPGKELALVSSMAAIGGLLLSLFIARRRLWLRARDLGSGRTLVTVAGLARTENSAVADDTKAALAAVVGETPSAPPAASAAGDPPSRAGGDR